MVQFNREGIEMKRLVTIVAIAILLIGSVLLGLNDTDTSVADISIPDNEIVSSVSSNPSVTATITMTGAPDE